MAAKRKIAGPYRVKNFSVNTPSYTIVEMMNNKDNTYQELRPSRSYNANQRSAAYAMCGRLNQKWQDTQRDSGDLDLISYWEEATN